MEKKVFRAYDVFGNIAVVKFPEKTKTKEKKLHADKILKNNGSVKTVLEKTEKFKGRLRLMQTKYLAGERTKEVLYRENGCVFRFNIDETYFSPRLSNERKELAEKINKKENVLVMFAGVAPFSIVIARKSGANVVSNEINRKANEYAKMNIELNNLKYKVFLAPGDIKRIADRLPQKFDVIVMPRPQLKDSFLKQAFQLSKKGTRIFYYDFCDQQAIESVVDKVKHEAKKAKKKIKILRKKVAGEVGPYRVRVRIDVLVY